VTTAGQGAREAFERLAACVPVAPSVLSDQQLVDLMTAATDAARHAAAIELGAARELDNRSDPTLGDESLAARLGQRSVVEVVEYASRRTRPSSQRLVRLSRSLQKLPVVDGAVTRGEVTLDQAEAITSRLNPALHAAAPADVTAAETQLCELAQTLPADALRDAAELWAQALDPDGVEPREELAMQKRFFTIGHVRNGLAKVSGLLPAEHAATIRALLDAYANPKSSKGVAFAPADSVAESEPDDPRTPGQRRADLVRDVFAAQARDAEAPTMGGAHPTRIVTIDGAALEARRGAAFVDGESEGISAAAAEQIACTGGSQRLVFGSNGEVLHLARGERIFSPAQRRALAARDRGCVIPGCTIPAKWCEAHHVCSWRQGGLTDIGNAALLCWYHHRHIDTGPWRVRIVDGVPEVRWVYGSHVGPWARANHLRPPGRSPDLRAA
jgi:hypothetical protein